MADVDEIRMGNLPAGKGRGDKVVTMKVSAQDGDSFDTGLDEIYSINGNGTNGGEIVSFSSITDGSYTLAVHDDTGAIAVDQTIYITAYGRVE